MNRYQAESIDLDLAAQDAARNTPQALRRRVRQLSDRVACLAHVEAQRDELLAICRDLKTYLDGVRTGQPEHLALAYELYQRLGIAIAHAEGHQP